MKGAEGFLGFFMFIELTLTSPQGVHWGYSNILTTDLKMVPAANFVGNRAPTPPPPPSTLGWIDIVLFCEFRKRVHVAQEYFKEFNSKKLSR